LLFRFTSEYAIGRVQKNQEWLKLNRSHHLLAYADDINVVIENTEALLDANKEVSLEVNPEKNKYMWKNSNLWEQH
jgi:hypothetical protein